MTCKTPNPKLAARINAEHKLAVKAAGDSLLHARRCGELLAQAKAPLDHGDWLPWVEKHLAFGPRQAQRYMRLAERWEDIRKCDSEVAYERSIEGALSLVAEPAVDDADVPGDDTPAAPVPPGIDLDAVLDQLESLPSTAARQEELRKGGEAVAAGNRRHDRRERLAQAARLGKRLRKLLEGVPETADAALLALAVCLRLAGEDGPSAAELSARAALLVALRDYLDAAGAGGGGTDVAA